MRRKTKQLKVGDGGAHEQWLRGVHSTPHFALKPFSELRRLAVFTMGTLQLSLRLSKDEISASNQVSSGQNTIIICIHADEKEFRWKITDAFIIKVDWVSEWNSQTPI